MRRMKYVRKYNENMKTQLGKRGNVEGHHGLIPETQWLMRREMGKGKGKEEEN